MFGNKLRQKVCPISTLIGTGTRIEGGLTYSDGLHVDGTVLGDIAPWDADEAADAYIGERGMVKGSVRGTNVTIHGTIDGDVYASGHVTIGCKAQINGDVVYKTLTVDRCGAVRGRLIPLGMLGIAEPKEHAARPVEATPERYADLVQLMRRSEY